MSHNKRGTAFRPIEPPSRSSVASEQLPHGSPFEHRGRRLVVRLHSIGLLLAAIMVAGCFEDGTLQAATQSDGSSRPTTVVAVIDSGGNPYHDVFRADGQRSFNAGGGQKVHLTATGAYAERVAADASTWADLQERELYHFAGTRLSGISFTDEPGGLVLDHDGHGTAVASVIAAGYPDVEIVAVQVRAGFCFAADCILDPTIVEGIEWAAAQPWIDVISISLAPPGNAPTSTEFHSDARRITAATRAAHEAGKLVVVAAGNTPPPTLTSFMSGPPWIVAVGGANETTRGATIITAKGADVVANYTSLTADYDSIDGWRVRSGTSFAAPQVAGIIAESLFMLRGGGGARDPACPTVEQARDIRPFLNASAEPFAAAEYDGLVVPSAEDPGAIARLTAPVVDAPLQQGWGYLDGRHVDTILALGACTESLDEDERDVAPRMRQWQQVRESYWTTV